MTADPVLLPDVSEAQSGRAQSGRAQSEESLPDGWQEMSLGEVATLQRGKDLPESERLSGPYPVVGSNGIVGFHSSFVSPGPGVLVGRSGSVGKVAWIDQPYWPLNTSLWVVDFHGNEESFIAFLLDFLDLGQFTSGVSVPTLNRNVIYPLRVHLPPLAEQRAIAASLRAAQAAAQARRRAAELERERKAALMQALLSGKAVERQSDKAKDELPKGWRWVKLGEIAYLESGGTPSKDRPEWWQGTIPWVSAKDLKRPRLRDVTDHITEEALENGSRLAPAGALFIVVRGMILAKDIPIALAEVPMAFNQDIKAILPNKSVLSEYLLYALAQRKDDMVHIIGSSSHGTRRIGSDDLASTLLPLPSLAEQREIAGALRACDAAIAGLEQEAVLHEELFRALLEELMTGRVRAVKR